MSSLKQLKPFFKKQLFTILLGVITLVLLDILTLIIPRITKKAIDGLTALEIGLMGLFSYAGIIIGLALIITGLRYVSRRSLFGVSRILEEGLRNQLFTHIQTLSASYFDRARTGDLMAHATNDIQNVRMAAGMGMAALTDAVFLGFAAIGFMAYINVKLTAMVFIPMPLVILGSRILGKNMHRRYQQVQASFSDLTEAVRERFTGIRVIKSYSREEDEIEFISSISRNYIDKNMELVRVTGFFFPMMLFFSNLSLTLILYFGGRQTILAVITPGDFVAFISYLGLLTWPMMALGWVTNLIQRGKASLDRIQAILLTTPDIRDTQKPSVLIKKACEIRFKNVSFTYQDRENPALSNICFTLSPGRTLGIVGPQGSGKTTLLSLIPRIYDVTSGCVLLDGVDIREIHIEALRSRISYMPQEPILFAGSIRDNMDFAAGEKGPRNRIEAAEKASFYDTVKSFPEGFDTLVGERGIILSGGQKQRVTLARTFLHNTAVMILDDPISQVDKETGDRIIRSVRSMGPGKTMIIVSHRLSAVEFADDIMVLDNGRIAAMGPHEALLRENPYYQKTYDLQKIERDFNAQ
jgi:ATP-binding cassette, subfamily B, multidrug efflux pump